MHDDYYFQPFLSQSFIQKSNLFLVLVSVTMGSLISVFRKGDLDTESQLAEIEKNLKNHKELKEKAQLRKEKIVKTFRFYGYVM